MRLSFDESYDRQLVIELTETYLTGVHPRDQTNTLNSDYLGLLARILNVGPFDRQRLFVGRNTLLGKFLRTHFPMSHRVWDYVSMRGVEQR